jgi:hypothetical protein
MSPLKAAQRQPDVLSSVSTPAVQPMFLDIQVASAVLGLSVFAVRNICWHKLLRPVRHGKKYLFTPQMLTEFRDKLVSGQVVLPASPSKPAKSKAKGRAA